MKVYIGLPEHLVKSIIWVARQFRTNPLSHIAGGCDVVIEYKNSSSYGYDWVKIPSRYIDTIFKNHFEKFHNISLIQLTTAEQLVFFKEMIFKIFARKYDNTAGYENQPFEEVWNSETATQLPVNVLKRFDPVYEQDYNYDMSDEYFKAVNPDYSDLFPICEVTLLKQKVEVVNTKNLRKEKKELYLSKFNLLSPVDKLKEICNNGKPLEYYPVDHSTIPNDIFYNLTFSECNKLKTSIQKLNERVWNRHLYYLNETIENYFKKKKNKIDV